MSNKNLYRSPDSPKEKQRDRQQKIRLIHQKRKISILMKNVFDPDKNLRIFKCGR